MWTNIILVITVGVVAFTIVFLSGICVHNPKWYNGHQWTKWEKNIHTNYRYQVRRCECCGLRQYKE